MEDARSMHLQAEFVGVSYLPLRRCACATAVFASLDLRRWFLCCQLRAATLVTPLRVAAF